MPGSVVPVKQHLQNTKLQVPMVYDSMPEYYLENGSYSSDDDLVLINNSSPISTSNPVNDSIHNNGICSEENTMEIPLLEDNDELYPNQPYDKCRYGQQGFCTHLKNKRDRDAKLKILLAITLCCIFMIIEFLGGYMAGSLAIMTDAAHLASDCVSFVIGLLAIWISSRPPDQNMSFGYKRIEVMGAVVSVLVIWILTAALVVAAVQRIISNDFTLNPNTMMIIAGIGILINVAMVFVLHGSTHFSNVHGHSHGHNHTQQGYSQLPNGGNSLATEVTSAPLPANGIKDQHHQQEQEQRNNMPSAVGQDQNLNLRAAVLHVIGDLVQSVGVFVASVIIKFYPNAKLADPLCTLVFSVIVGLTTVGLMKDSVAVLMDSVPKLVSLRNLQNDLSSINGVKFVHHLNVWNHTINHGVMTVHLCVDDLTDIDAVLREATTLAHNRHHIKHSTIQIEKL